MAGIVEKVAVKVGQTVAAGDLLCVVSAMKMEVRSSHLAKILFVLPTKLVCLR